MDCSMPDFFLLHYLMEIAETHVHWVGDVIQPSQSLSSLLLLPLIFPGIRGFSIELAAHIRWPKYWSFNFNISPSNEYSGLISFRIDWFDFLGVQGTLKSLLQYSQFERINSSVLSLLYDPTLKSGMTTGNTIALTIWAFVGKVMSLLFNKLSTFVIAFLPRSKHLLISWLQSSSTVILEPKKIKSVNISTFPPCICHEVMGPGSWSLFFAYWV